MLIFLLYSKLFVDYIVKKCIKCLRKPFITMGYQLLPNIYIHIGYIQRIRRHAGSSQEIRNLFFHQAFLSSIFYRRKVLIRSFLPR